MGIHPNLTLPMLAAGSVLGTGYLGYPQEIHLATLSTGTSLRVDRPGMGPNNEDMTLAVIITAAVDARGGAQLAAALGQHLARSALVGAAVAGRPGAVLIDLDFFGGGLDVALGIERVAGVRWSDLVDLANSAQGEPLLSALPKTGQLALLSASRSNLHPAESEVTAVLQVLAQTAVPLVVWVPRAALDLVRNLPGNWVRLVLCRAELPSLVSAQQLLHPRWQSRGSRAEYALVGPGGIPSSQAAEYLGTKPLSWLAKRNLPTAHHWSALRRPQRRLTEQLSNRLVAVDREMNHGTG